MGPSPVTNFLSEVMTTRGLNTHPQRRIASLMRYVCFQVEVAMNPKIHSSSSWLEVLAAGAVRVAFAKIPLHPSR